MKRADAAGRLRAFHWVVPTVWLLLLLATTWGYVEDDGYIHLEYARSLASGDGFTFKGLASYGDTSPGWVFLLTAVHLLVGNWILASKLLCLAAAGFCLAGAHALAFRLGRERAMPDGTAATFVLLVAVNPFFVFWSFAGMEAVMALGLTFWIFVVSQPQTMSARRLYALAALSSVAVLLRPELVLLGALVLLLGSWRLHRTRGAGIDRGLVLQLAMACGIAVLPIVAWLGFAWLEFGTIVPNTNAAKRVLAGHSLSMAAGVQRLVSVTLLGFGPESILLGICLLAMVFTQRGRRALGESVGPIWPVLAWPLILSAFYVANRTAVQTRYVLLLGPFITLSALCLLHASQATLLTPISARRRHSLRIAAVAGIALVSIFVDLASVRPHLRNKIQRIEARREITAFIRETVPASEPIASYAIGQIAFETPNPIIDLGGLVMPEGQAFLSDKRRMYEWAKSRGARHFMAETKGYGELEEIFDVPWTPAGWSFRRSFYEGTRRYPLRRLRAADPPAGDRPDAS